MVDHHLVVEYNEQARGTLCGTVLQISITLKHQFFLLTSYLLEAFANSSYLIKAFYHVGASYDSRLAFRR